MARNAGTFVENQFVQGLITEATGLNFPEKAVIESWNTRFKKTGEVVRRFGFDAEGSVHGTAGTFSNGVRTSYLWDNPGKTDQTFLVIQTGRYLSFFVNDSFGNFSAGKKAYTIDLEDHKVSTADVASIRNNAVSMIGAEGKLFVVHPYAEPFYVTYSGTTDLFTEVEYEIQIRDTEGVDDGLAVDENPTTLSNLHHYNLWNQGWKTDRVSAGFNNNHANAIEFFLVATDKYPNNCQIWWAYKGANSEGKESLQYDQTRMVLFGNSAAPKGHFIYNAFDIDRETVSGLSGIPRTRTDKRPTCVSLFSGRIWYAGVDDQVYYSQVIENDETYGKCYQKNDPTSETLSDLLETDGGVIKILGLGKATALFAAGNAILVFSNNGIWRITGSGAEGTGFNATDFAVSRISTVGLVSGINILDVEGTPIWWNLEGIWTISENGVQSLTNDTIKSFIDDEIPVSNRAFIQGAYNQSERTIQWLYRSTAFTNAHTGHKYDRILEFNVTTGAFYPFKWNANHQELELVFCVTGITSEDSISETVVTSSDVTITDSALVDVTVEDELGVTFKNTQYKYFASTTSAFTFFEEIDADYLDWTTTRGTGVNFDSYFISGAKVHGEGRAGSIEYVTVFCNTVSNGSVRLQTKWDWTNSGTSGKWSTPQECYSSARATRDVSRKRLLVRGQGPALQLHFSSVQGKPFSVIGWSSFETVDAIP